MWLIEVIIERRNGFVLKCIDDRIVLVTVDLFVIDNGRNDDTMKVGDEMVVIDNNHGMEGADADNLDLLHPSIYFFFFFLVWLCGVIWNMWFVVEDEWRIRDIHMHCT